MNSKKKKIIPLGSRLKQEHFAEQFNSLDFESKQADPKVAVEINPERDLEDIWQDEISALLGKDFSDIEAVIQAISTATADKMALSDEERPEVVEFLKLYFETDPDLLASLSEIFLQQ